jgi:hypothetical protein
MLIGAVYLRLKVAEAQEIKSNIFYNLTALLPHENLVFQAFPPYDLDPRINQFY